MKAADTCDAARRRVAAGVGGDLRVKQGPRCRPPPPRAQARSSLVSTSLTLPPLTRAQASAEALSAVSADAAILKLLNEWLEVRDLLICVGRSVRVVWRHQGM